MGIRFYCPKGHKLNVKAELAGKIGFCPECGERMMIPFESTREPSHKKKHRDKETSDQTVSASVVVTAETPEIAEPEPEVSVQVHQQETASVPPEISAPEQTAPAAAVSGLSVPEEASSSEKKAAEPSKTEEKTSSQPEEPAAEPVQPPAAPAGGIESNPLLADPNLVWYTRGTDNQSYGPVSNVVMAGWLKERRIGPTMLVWREGWTSWLEAKNVFPELEAVFMAPAVPSIQTPPANPEKSPETAPSPITAPSAPAPAIVEPKAAEPAQAPDLSAFVPDESVSREIERKKAAAKKRKKKQNQELALVIGLIVVIVTLLCVLIGILLRQNHSVPVPEQPAPASVPAPDPASETAPQAAETPADSAL